MLGNWQSYRNGSQSCVGGEMTEDKKSWESYEEVAAYLLGQMADEFAPEVNAAEFSARLTG